MDKNEVTLELSFTRRFNLGNFNHKELMVKLSGTENQIQDQFQERKKRVTTLLEQIEQMVEDAHSANLVRAELVKKENELKIQTSTRLDGVQ